MEGVTSEWSPFVDKLVVVVDEESWDAALEVIAEAVVTADIDDCCDRIDCLDC